MTMNKENINVLNYNSHIVIVQTKTDSYEIPAAFSDTEPTVVPLSLADIVYINSVSAVFRNGTLRFDSDVEAEVYQELKIRNAEQILKNTEIDEILLNPTVEGLQKIVGITDAGAFERVRGRCTMLQNAGHDISTRVKRVVDRRYEELRAKRVKTDIILTPKVATKNSTSDAKVASLEAQLAAQSAQIDQLLAMVSQMQTATVNTASAPVVSEPVAETKKTTKTVSKSTKAKSTSAAENESKAD
jgi:hypothetical protein